MSELEIAEFVIQQRTGTLATMGLDGQPHLVAMWYAVIDDVIWFEAKRKSQKVVNLRRDNRASFLIESGLTYQTLRGVSFEGRGEVFDDDTTMWPVGVSMFNRYHGEYTESENQRVQSGLFNRVVIRLNVERVRTWNHRKLGLAEEPPSGSTARFISHNS
jgi:PPOX class probable F420-dependent enzyme